MCGLNQPQAPRTQATSGSPALVGLTTDQCLGFMKVMYVLVTRQSLVSPKSRDYTEHSNKFVLMVSQRTACLVTFLDCDWSVVSNPFLSLVKADPTFFLGVSRAETFRTILSEIFPVGDSTKYAYLVFNSLDEQQTGKWVTMLKNYYLNIWTFLQMRYSFVV